MDAKTIKDRLDIITLHKDDYNMIMKDRLDFGFDSIYFRYAEVVKELSWFKEREAIRAGKPYFDRKQWEDTRLMHFYNTLEQLLHAHEDRKNGWA